MKIQPAPSPLSPAPHNRYAVNLPHFSGPLDLLLHLIERNQLDITAISLSAVTDQYLAQVERLKGDRVAQLMDFILIGARLLVIKSRALLPRPPVAPDEEEIEDPAEGMARQLREYKRYKEVANWLGRREAQGLRTYLRLAPPPKLESRLDLSGVTLDTLIAAMEDALKRGQRLDESVSVARRPRAYTIERQTAHLRRCLRASGSLSFRQALSEAVTWAELSMTLLALLEMVKLQEVAVRQDAPFGPIMLTGLAAAI
ncbi:MAG: segregation and condensation protein A [Candidatus Promineifilaceae bacterium]